MASGNRLTIVQNRHEGIICLEKQSFKEAESYLRTALEGATEQRNAETFMLMQRLAESLIGQTKFTEAEALAQKAMNGFRRFGPDDEDMLDSQCLLAESLYGQRRYLDAGDAAKSALALLESNMKRGPEHVVTLRCRGVLAQALKGQCKFQDAVALARSNLEFLEATRIKTEKNEAAGSRRVSQTERQAFGKIEAISRKVLGGSKETLGEDSVKVKSPKRTATIESTVSTTTPDSDNEQSSRFSSQQSSRMPSKEINAA